MNIKDIYQQKNDFFYKPSSTARGAMFFCLMLLLLGIGLGLFSTILGDKLRFWGSFLLSVFFFYSIALGGVAFGAMQDTIGAKWGRPVKRIHESFGSFLIAGSILIVMFLLMVKFQFLEAHKVFSWIAHPEFIQHFAGKRDWLTVDFLIYRDIGALALVLVLYFWQRSKTLNRDAILLKGDVEKAQEVGATSQQSLRYFSAPLLVVYALCYSLLSFDLTMSLAPTWFSTLWAGLSFSIMMQTLMAMLLLFMFAMRGSGFSHLIKRQQFHDVGKLMHGFTIFFAYLTYSHVLTYWYGNIPEETEYFIHRLHQPWLTLIFLVLGLAFVFPLFSLIPKASKWTAGLTIPIAVIILGAQFLSYIVFVIPEVVAAESWRGPTIELLMFLGMLGIFMASIFRFAHKHPMVSVADPIFLASLKESAHH